MVGERPAHLVRAVMESVHNGRRLSREDALKRETGLFCRLASALASEKLRG